MTYLKMPSFIILSLTHTMLSTSLIVEMCEMLVKPWWTYQTEHADHLRALCISDVKQQQPVKWKTAWDSKSTFFFVWGSVEIIMIFVIYRQSSKWNIFFEKKNWGQNILMQCLCMTIIFRSLDANQLFQKGLCKFSVFTSKSGEYC